MCWRLQRRTYRGHIAQRRLGEKTRGQSVNFAEGCTAQTDRKLSEEVSIVGQPHERWGEAPHAFVVLRQGAQTDEAELREFARANLAHFKAPHSVTFVQELPKTATGKIQKYILRGRTTAIAPQ